MSNCTIITAIICVLITTVAVIVSFATPNWARFERDRTTPTINGLCQCDNCDCGMWMYCANSGQSDGSIDNCKWFFAEDFKIEKDLPDWFKAVQGLMSCAVASSLLSLLIGLLSLCCSCKSCNPSQAAGAFINLTFLLVTAAVCLFGAKGHLDYNLDVVVDDEDLNKVNIFGWSFWVAVAGAGMALISSIMYFCVGRTDEYV